jgi:hypothetical protein
MATPVLIKKANESRWVMWHRFTTNLNIRRFEHLLIRDIDAVQRDIVEHSLRAERLKRAARDASAVDAGRLFHGERGARREFTH